uniref:RRM domain-containing protein n=1 Tax=Ditylenchus dipsaci TaxID=166011 RepID=A0A915DRE5_9BILA
MAYSVGDISSLINVAEKKSTKRKRKEKFHDKDAVVDDDSDVTEKIVVKTKPKLEKNVVVEPQRNRTAERKEAEDRTIFVGMPHSSKRRDIQKLFSRFGPIEAVYQRSLLQKNEKLTLRMLGTDKKIEKNLTSTNFFVRFKSPEDAKTSEWFCARQPHTAGNFRQ